jgi:hypothetical protein
MQHSTHITYYDALLPGHVTCEPVAMPECFAVGLLQEHGYTPRFDGADVFDHYDGTRLAVLSNTVIRNEELYRD